MDYLEGTGWNGAGSGMSAANADHMEADIVEALVEVRSGLMGRGYVCS